MNQADALDELRTGLSRLTPDWQRPERFHEAKSELMDRLNRFPTAASGDVTDRIARARTTAQGEQIREMQRQLRVLTKAVTELGKARTPKRKERDTRQAEMIER